ncbi:hypothetical protein QBA35_37135 [Streptomyces bottropensis]|jgi:hypothetical protein|uniref:Uncharacterized protein n=1 Tax=Streptomyces bottropensis TaxID=42235 RepID=A0ABU8B027_9ACTN
MTYTRSARQPEPEPHPTWTRGAEHLSGGPESSAASSAANDDTKWSQCEKRAGMPDPSALRAAELGAITREEHTMMRG